jgi:mannitol/fructose-specific phosphotransferase system IIA component
MGELLSADSLADIFSAEGIRLVQRAHDKWDALHQAASLLVSLGAVTPEYEASMLERENQISTYMGEGVAIPHGTNSGRSAIRKSAVGFIQYPAGVDWDGEIVHLVIPIAAQGEEQVDLLSAIAMVLMEPGDVSALRQAASEDEVISIIRKHA